MKYPQVMYWTSVNMLMVSNFVDSQKNTFSSVSAKGKAVVDYVAVPYTSLQYITGFKIIGSSCLVNLSCKKMSFESRHVPDHSLLKCSITLVGHESQNKGSISNLTCGHLLGKGCPLGSRL